VIANAAAAFLVSGVVETWQEGARLAEKCLDEGRGSGALERLRDATERAG
jgi:anthranilate phosphoribosyltransferase